MQLILRCHKCITIREVLQELYLLGFAYCIFGVYLVVSITNKLRAKTINTDLVVDVFVTAFYVLPNITRCFPELVEGIDTTVSPNPVSLLFILLFYVSVRFGRRIVLKQRKRSENIGFYIPNEECSIRRVANITLIVSTLFFVMYAALFGGVNNLFRNILSIRNGNIESTNSKYEFISKLYNSVIYAPILLTPYLNKGKTISKSNIYVAFIIALLLKISTGSRGALLLYILMFFLASYISSIDLFKGMSPIKTVVIVAFIFFCLIIYRPLLVALGVYFKFGANAAVSSFNQILFSSGGRYSANSISDVALSLHRSFQHYSISLDIAIDKVFSGEHKMNFFLEFIAMLEAVIPSKLLGIKKMPGITTYNSVYVSSLIKSYDGANVPPGIIASAVYSGGFVWISFYGILIGMIGKGIDDFYYKIKENVKFSHLYYISILFVYYAFAASGDFTTQFGKSLTTFIVIFFVNSLFRPKYATESKK